ncbi:MAG: hypothetical protein ABGZ35_10385 [Planctomycetaceae bacterium]
MRTPSILALSGAVAVFCCSTPGAAATLNLSGALIVGAEHVLPPKTIIMLQEEIEERSAIRLRSATSIPTAGQPLILIGTREAFPGGAAIPPGILRVPQTPDGYAIWVDAQEADSPRVYLLGNDGRGALFAVGRLLRKLVLAPGKIELPSTLALSREPQYSIRGHQIGYRHTANTYDAWDVETYEQYIRDLILFGTNSVELILEGGRGYRDGPVLQHDQWDMNVLLTQMIQEYEIDIWLWEPLKVDIADPVVAEAAMRRRAEFYAECARIDHVMVPGGDPGHTDPRLLMPWLRRQADVLHNVFPDAGLWVSHQKFNPEQLDYFFSYLRQNQPDWLAGVVFGPGTGMSLEETRRRTPERYPIRRYPDITHNIRCQYPIPKLDGILAQTLGREGINPRPAAMSHIHDLLAKFSDGFVSYSDGAHDDLNKMVWSELGWGGDADLDEILLDYGRVFFGEDLAPDAALGLRMLEQNLNGLVRDNAAIDATLHQWQHIERRGGLKLRNNWRFQMYLFRAMFDSYIRSRHLVELGYEQQAMRALSQATDAGVQEAIANARAALAQPDRTRVFLDQRILLEEMGVKLLRLIGFQMSIDEPFLARNPERGALLDKLDRPLNDRLWLEAEFQKISAVEDADLQLAMIDRIVHWEDPGPGGFYDDLGNATKQPHLVRTSTQWNDPGFVRGPQEAHYRSLNNYSRGEISPLKWSWLDYAQGTPMMVRYENLPADAKYRLRVTYHGRFAPVMTLTANGHHELHGALPMPVPVWPVEFDIPHALTRDGRLELRWDLVDRRGCQVAEVWLMRR